MGKGFPKHLLNAIALIAMLFSAPAWAQGANHGDGAAVGGDKDARGNVIYDAQGNVWRLQRGDGNGNTYTREAFPATFVARNTGIASYPMAAREIKRGIAQIYGLRDLGILITASTAIADTDSVAAVVYSYVKETSNVADGLDAPIQSFISVPSTDSTSGAWGLQTYLHGWFVGGPLGWSTYATADLKHTCLVIGNKMPLFSSASTGSYTTSPGGGPSSLRTMIFYIPLPATVCGYALEVTVVNPRALAQTMTVDVIGRGY